MIIKEFIRYVALFVHCDMDWMFGYGLRSGDGLSVAAFHSDPSAQWFALAVVMLVD